MTGSVERTFELTIIDAATTMVNMLPRVGQHASRRRSQSWEDRGIFEGIAGSGISGSGISPI
jgi:hypothetical protein